MAKDWIIVRLQRDTHAALRRVRESLRFAEERGWVELETDDRDRVALDTVIDWLVGMYDRHAERRRRSAARRARARRARATEADTIIDRGETPPDPPDRSSSPFLVDRE